MPFIPTRPLVLALLLAALSPSACTQAPSRDESAAMKAATETHLLPASAAERAEADRRDLLGQATFWGAEYDKNPNEYEAALKFARVLRAMGSHAKAMEITSQALTRKPGDPELTLVFAQAALEVGTPEAAVGPLLQAEGPGAADWRIASIIGVTLNSLDRHKEAQGYYKQALKLAPDNPKVLSNLGLSQALSGEAAEAEATLRHASTLPLADVRVRQNLAIVLGVQGKFDEASALLSEDTPGVVAESNLAYFRNLLTPARSWDGLRGAKSAKPDKS